MKPKISCLSYVIYACLVMVPVVFFHPSYNSVKGVFLIFFVFLGWIFIYFFRRPGLSGQEWSVVVPLLFFWASGPVSLIGASSWPRGLERIVVEFGLFGFYLLALAVLGTRRSKELAARVALLPAGLIALVGILQMLTVLPLPLDRYGHPDPASFMGLSNFASEYMIILVPMALWGFAMRKRFQAPALVIIALCLLYMLFSQNRTAWVALGISLPASALLLVFWLFLRRSWPGVLERRIVVPLAVFAGIIALVMVFSGKLPALTSRARSIVNFQDASIQYRLHLWNSCFRLFQSHPIAGIGVGNLEAEVPTVWSRELEHMVLSQGLATQKAHNFFLEVLAERGVLGFAALIWLLFALGRFLAGNLRSCMNQNDFLWYLAIFSGLMSGLAGSLFSFCIQSPASGMAFWLLAGLIPIVKEESKSEPVESFRAVPFILIAVSLFSLVWFGRFAVGETYELRALEHVMKGEKESAFRSYSRALRIYPHLPVARERLAALLAEKGETDAAIRELQQVFSLLPHSVPSRDLLASLLARRGGYSEAAVELERILGLVNSPRQRNRFLTRLTGLAVLSGQYETAAGYGREAVALDPADPATHFYFGLASLGLGEVSDARRSLEESVRIQPDSAWGWYYLGISYHREKKEELSRSAFRRAVALDERLQEYAERSQWILPGHILGQKEYDPEHQPGMP